MKKFNLVIPIAGLGSRFAREQYYVPKPLILIDDRSIIEWTMDSIDHSNCNLIFIVREEHILEFSIDDFLRNKFGEDIKIISTNKTTEGAVCSVRLAENLIDNDAPLIVHCSDIFCEPKINPEDFFDNSDGTILTFKSNSANYSYSEIENGKVVKVAEKQVISDQASVGIYFFKTGHSFMKYSDQMIINNLRTNNEFFIAPLYNLLIEDNLNIVAKEVQKMHIFGTPEEYSFFVNNSLKTWPINKRTVAICSDHSGFAGKEIFKAVLMLKKIQYIDFGTYNSRDCDYGEFVKMACEAVSNNKCDLAFGFCRSGQGVNIQANKNKKIRAALVIDPYLAEYSVRHNCANFFSIGTKYLDGADCVDKYTKILDAVMNNTFDGGRHQTRIQKL